MMPAELLSGPLAIAEHSWPLCLTVHVHDLRPSFIAKCRVGKGYRAIARNGRVLLASDLPLSDLVDRDVHLRMQTWQRAILPGDRPEPYGVLLCLRLRGGRGLYDVCVVEPPAEGADLVLDIGGGRVLALYERDD